VARGGGGRRRRPVCGGGRARAAVEGARGGEGARGRRGAAEATARSCDGEEFRRRWRRAKIWQPGGVGFEVGLLSVAGGGTGRDYIAPPYSPGSWLKPGLKGGL